MWMKEGSTSHLKCSTGATIARAMTDEIGAAFPALPADNKCACHLVWRRLSSLRVQGTFQSPVPASLHPIESHPISKVSQG